MNDSVKIEKGIPIPHRGRHTELLLSMNKGDSFTTLYTSRAAIYQCALRHGIKLVTRKERDGSLRVWKVK